MLTVDQVIALSDDAPGALFDSPDTIKDTYRRLVKDFHPDTHGSDVRYVEAIQKIQRLHDLALASSKNGIWEVPPSDGKKGNVLFSTGTSSFRIHFHRKHSIAIGNMYVADECVAFSVKKENRDLHDSFLRNIRFKYPSKKVEDEMSRLLPGTPKKVFEAGDRIVTVVEKTKDVVLLRDVLSHVGRMDPRHIAWIMSRLYNLACYLEVSHVSHNDISLDSVFISPEMHSALLLGGWWYTTPRTGDLKVLPQRSVRLMDPTRLASKTVDPKLDLNCILAIGREMFGTPDPIMLKRNKDVPEYMSSWLRFPHAGTATQIYAEWYKTLEKTFGPRRFTKFDLTADEVYGKNP